MNTETTCSRADKLKQERVCVREREREREKERERERERERETIVCLKIKDGVAN